MDLEATVKSLQEEMRNLTVEIHQLQRQQSSRRGPEGARGPQGEPGRDAVVKIIQADGKVQVVSVDGQTQGYAELVPVVGPAGKDGESIKGPQGDPGPRGAAGRDGREGIDGEQGVQGPQGIPGKDGRVPTEAEILDAVRKVLRSV